MNHSDIGILPLDHPGAQDMEYRARRDAIAQAAAAFRADPREIPLVAYSAEEHRTWQTALETLQPLHEQYACKRYLAARRALDIPTDRVPQLRELDARLSSMTGFHLEPIEGLVDSRSFLSRLEDRVMLCTQYIRHHSRPDYTPEPDIIHEVIGHTPTFTDPDIVHLSQEIGRAAKKASEAELQALERLYWFTLEFGLLQEDSEVKVFGAGLLSSFGEMRHAYSKDVTWRPFSIDEVVRTPFDFSTMQSTLFIVPSFATLRAEVERYFAIH